MSSWSVGAARDLPLDETSSFDGAAAKARIFDWAGGDEFDPNKAKRAFLVYDTDDPKLRGSFKLPFSDVKSGTLTAVKAGLNNAASRLPQTDVPQATRDTARKVIDGYQAKYTKADPSPSGAERHLPPLGGVSPTESTQAPAFPKRKGSAASAVEIRDALTIVGDGSIAPQTIALRAEPTDGERIPGYDGHFCTWNTVDAFGTFFTRGAFKKSLIERAAVAPVLWQHDRDMPIGTHLEIKEDKQGVFARTKLIEGVAKADDALLLMRHGVHLGLSFGFQTVKDRAATEDDEIDFSVAPAWCAAAPRDEIRAITEVAFWESSPVTFAANEKAAPSKVRALTDSDVLRALVLALRFGVLDEEQTHFVNQIVAAHAERAGAGIEVANAPGHSTQEDVQARQRQIALTAALAKTALALSGVE